MELRESDRQLLSGQVRIGNGLIWRRDPPAQSVALLVTGRATGRRLPSGIGYGDWPDEVWFRLSDLATGQHYWEPLSRIRVACKRAWSVVASA